MKNSIFWFILGGIQLIYVGIDFFTGKLDAFTWITLAVIIPICAISAFFARRREAKIAEARKTFIQVFVHPAEGVSNEDRARSAQMVLDRMRHEQV